MVASRVVGRLRRLRIGSPWVGPTRKRTSARRTDSRRRFTACKQLLSYDKASDADEILRELDAAVRSDVGEVRRDLHDVSDRVARIEGALTVRVGAVPGGAAAPALPVAAGAGYR